MSPLLNHPSPQRCSHRIHDAGFLRAFGCIDRTLFGQQVHVSFLRFFDYSWEVCVDEARPSWIRATPHPIPTKVTPPPLHPDLRLRVYWDTQKIPTYSARWNEERVHGVWILNQHFIIRTIPRKKRHRPIHSVRYLTNFIFRQGIVPTALAFAVKSPDATNLPPAAFPNATEDPDGCGISFLAIFLNLHFPLWRRQQYRGAVLYKQNHSFAKFPFPYPSAIRTLWRMLGLEPTAFLQLSPCIGFNALM